LPRRLQLVVPKYNDSGLNATEASATFRPRYAGTDEEPASSTALTLLASHSLPMLRSSYLRLITRTGEIDG